MTWQFAQGTSTNLKSSGTTINASWAHVAGTHLFVGITFDNLSTTTPTVSSIYKPVGETNDWVLLAYVDSNQSGGGGGVRTELWGLLCTVSEAFASHAVTLSASVTAKAVSVLRYSGGPATMDVVSTTPAGISGSGTIGTAVSSLAGVTPQAGELVLVLAGWEGTDSEDSTMFAYDQWYTNGTSGQGGSSNVRVDFRGKIATTAGDMTIFLDVSGDKGICAVVLAAGPAAPPAYFTGSGTLEAHKTRYPDLVMQEDPKFYYRFNDDPANYPLHGLGDWWVTDSSRYARHRQVYPSNADPNLVGDPLWAGEWLFDNDASAREALRQPGLIHGGDTGEDYSVDLRADRAYAGDSIWLYLPDWKMDLVGGGRYLSPVNEGGPQRITFLGLVRLEAYPTVDMQLIRHQFNNYVCEITPSGQLQLGVNVLHGPVLDGYNYYYTLTGTTVLELNRTYHIGYTFDGSNLRVFVDGVEDGVMPVNYTHYAVAGQNEQQSVTINGSPTGGTWTLTWEGQTTTPLAYNADENAVRTALEAIFGVGNIGVLGSNWPALTSPFTVTFANDYGLSDQPMMTADGSGLTGGTSPSVTVALIQDGYPPSSPTTYTSGVIQWTSGNGGTLDNPYWMPGSRICYVLATGMPASRVDEIAFWARALTPAQVASMALAASVDPPGLSLWGSGTLRALQESYYDEVMVLGPEAYWRLSDAAGSTVMTDVSGNGRHGTYTGTPELGAASLLADAGNTAMIPSSTGVSGNGATRAAGPWMYGDGGDYYTWEFIIKVGPLVGTQYVWRLGVDALYITSDGYFQGAYSVGDGSTAYSFASNFPLVAGETYHVILERNRSHVFFWLNGELATSARGAGSTWASGSTGTLYLGRNSTGGTFRGTIDEVAIYSRLLTRHEIRNHVAAMSLASVMPHADFDGSGQLVADGIPAWSDDVALSGAGVLVASAGIAYFGEAMLSGDGQLTAEGVSHFIEDAAFSGLGSAFAVAIPRLNTTAAATGDGALTVTEAFRPIQRTDDPDSDTETDWTRTGFWGKARS